MRFDIYTDGSTKGNGQENAVGGWAYVIITQQGEHEVVCEQIAQAVKDTTNQRMELIAALEALKSIHTNAAEVWKHTIVIYSDSAYLINCYNQKWYKNWQKNGWKNSKKQSVANQDLWEQLIPYFDQPYIKWNKVQGHAGDKWNEYVDNLAQTAAEKYLKESK